MPIVACYLCGVGTGVCQDCLGNHEIKSLPPNLVVVSESTAPLRSQSAESSIDFEAIMDEVKNGKKMEMPPLWEHLPLVPPPEWELPELKSVRKKSDGKYADAMENEELVDDEQRRIRQVEDIGFTVLRGNFVSGCGWPLMLDLDTPASRKQYNEMIPMIVQNFKINIGEWWYSKSATQSNPKCHVRLYMDKNIGTVERCMLEVTLGSDPKRGVFNVRKWGAGISYPSLLFKPPVDLQRRPHSGYHGLFSEDGFRLP
jgi:hypothetical protein